MRELGALLWEMTTIVVATFGAEGSGVQSAPPWRHGSGGMEQELFATRGCSQGGYESTSRPASLPLSTESRHTISFDTKK